jgi:hypothetical protein
MPPFIYPSFEAIEAKEWASNTVSTILTDVLPVSFEEDFSRFNRPFPLKVTITTTTPEDMTPRRTKSSSNLRRSFSFFEGFSPQLQQAKVVRNSRRSQSTILPSTTADCTQSAPTTPTNYNKPLPHPSLSSRIRHTWHMDRASVGLLFLKASHHKKSNKELKGIATWENKKAEYVVKPPKSLEFEVLFFLLKQIKILNLITLDDDRLNLSQRDQLNFSSLS